MKRYCIAFAFVVVTAITMHSPAQDVQDVNDHTKWSYQGEAGPDHWGDLKAEYSVCKTGKEQSPIDIRDPKKADLQPIRFDYKSTPLKIINNGHTIQVNYAPGSFITVGDKHYELKQFHFHHPSEERINGQLYDMVVHLVHADSEGKLAVVAVLLKKGSSNRALDEIWTHFPKVAGEEQAIAGVQINATALLPHATAYYTYEGSLTTPPCTEGVTWLVLKTPRVISTDQIDSFAKIFPNNARPIQPVNGRVVKESR